MEKLAETAENLVRVDDLIAEIVDRLEPLKGGRKAERTCSSAPKRRLEIALLCQKKTPGTQCPTKREHALLVAEKERRPN